VNAAFVDLAVADLTGDSLPELVTVELYSKVAIVAKNDGTWTPPTELSVSDARVVEGNSGTANEVFTVTLANASQSVVSVDFSTADDNALAGVDYTARSGVLT